MDPPDIPGVFTDDGPQNMSVQAWRDALADLTPAERQRCRITRVIHVKNLRSWVAHEYLHIIVRDALTGFFTRIIAERHRARPPDTVTIGRWASWRHPNDEANDDDDDDGNPEAGGLLPIPLLSLEFNNLTLVRMANTLVSVSNVQPRYSVLRSYHCFWYARQVYESLWGSSSGRVWPWANYKGYALSWSWPSERSVLDELRFFMPRGEINLPVGNANSAFLISGAAADKPLLPSSGQENSGLVTSASVSTHLQNPSREQYLAYYQNEEDSELILATILARNAADVDDSRGGESPIAREDYDKDLRAFHAAMFADRSEAEANLNIYKERQKSKTGRPSEKKNSALENAWVDVLKKCVTLRPLEVTQEQTDMLEEAIGALVGGVIKNMEEKGDDNDDD